MHFFKVLPHRSANLAGWLYSPHTPKVERLHSLPRCPEAHLPSKPRWLIRTCRGLGLQTGPSRLGAAQQPWVSKEGWKRDRGRTAATFLSSELVEAIVFTKYSTVVWQTHSSGAGRWRWVPQVKREMERCPGKKDYEMTLLIQRRDESILNGRGGACRDRVSVVERDRVEH